VYQRKIVLDQESFKALASDTRIEILKRLDKSQMTVTDLANDLKVNKSAVYKHLSRLLDAGLVKKLEDNRKWVYYKLSMKGMHLMHPERVQIALMLSATFLSVLLAVSFIFSFFVGTVEEIQAPGEPEGVMTFVTVHEPVLLAAGAMLLALAAVLSYVAIRIRHNAKEYEPVL
jgi:DNA-binding transcriptional ArsR family regulator